MKYDKNIDNPGFHMKIMIDILHPAHVHFFKYFIKEIEKNGHEVMVTSREKEITNYLLDVYGIYYISISKLGNNKIDLARELLFRNIKFLKIAKKFKPDIMLGIMGPTIAPVGKIINIPSFVFYDSEVASITNFYVYPMASKIITPNSYREDLGEKQIKYNGFQETAYLHPSVFKPNPKILDELGVEKNEKYFILRFVSWQASHDININGLSFDNKKKLVEILSKYGKVFITSEQKMTSDLEKYRITIPPEKIHDALYYSTLFVGDSQTMSTEAAILGTPVVRCNAFVGANDMGNFIDLEEKYKLMFNYRNPDDAINKVEELLNAKYDLKKEWNKRKNNFFKDKVNVTDFMLNLVNSHNKLC